MQKAFAGPLRAEGARGHARSEAAREIDLEPAFREKPAIHRFPGAMAGRVRELAAVVADEYGGDASRIWTEPKDSRDLQQADRLAPRLRPDEDHVARRRAREAVRREAATEARARAPDPRRRRLPEALERYQ